MTKKKSKNTQKDPNFLRESEKYENPIPSREYILERLHKNNKPLNIKEIYLDLALTQESEIIALKRRLRAMVRDGQLTQDSRNRFGLQKATKESKGTVIGHKDGYGFVALETGGDDLFLGPKEMRSVFPGDTVLVRQIGEDHRGRGEAVVVEVLEHNTKSIIGRVFSDKYRLMVAPHDKRVVQDIVLDKIQSIDVKQNDIVIVDIVQQPTKQSRAVGLVIEVLGDHMQPGMEIDIAMHMHDIPKAFPEAVVKAAAKMPESVKASDLKGRKDLRDLPFVTIDGEDAKDFDDAVLCEKRANGGYRLLVAIADVSHYVKQRSPLDEEAISRGNSVYFPGRVIPMLPEALSNGLCSLNPKVDRLVMVCDMTIDQSGKVTRHQFYEGVIHSHARMTYTQVAQILQGDDTLIAQYQDRLPQFEALYDLYKVLKTKKDKRGALEFETVETRILFNDAGKIREILPTERNEAHKIIEECMLCANVCAAQTLSKNTQGDLYRIHEGPNPEKLQDVRQLLTEKGLALGGGEDVHPRDYAKVIKQIENRPDAKMLNTVLLRSLKQAVYSVDEVGHFGLAYEAYTHFTSPIRRYPDLIVHRMLKSIITKRQKRLYSDERLEEIALHCSTTERRADEATREAVEWLKCEFMQDKVGQVFSGTITGVTQFGLFVLLDCVYVEGLVHISSMRDDYYIFDPLSHSLMAERTRKTFQLGGTVRVQVARVNLEDRQIDFVLESKSVIGAKKKAAKKSSKKKSKKAKRKKKS